MGTSNVIVRSAVFQIEDTSRASTVVHGEIRKQLGEILSRATSEGRTQIGVIHGVTFPSGLSDEGRLAINAEIGRAYRDLGVSVVGGDTSSGDRFTIVMSLLLAKEN